MSAFGFKADMAKPAPILTALGMLYVYRCA